MKRMTRRQECDIFKPSPLSMAYKPELDDPFLCSRPGNVLDVFSPVERVLARLELDGTVDCNGSRVVFQEGATYYDLPAALNGLIEFHEIASAKYGMKADVSALKKLSNKIAYGSPLFESDIAGARKNIAGCKAQAMNLRISQAASIIRPVQISAVLDAMKVAA